MPAHPAHSVPVRRDTLVSVVATDADLSRFRDEGWYRLPDRVLGRSLGRNVLEEIEYLAIYQTGGITDGLPGSIELFGEVESVESLLRRDLLPGEADHPAANQIYHRIRLSTIHRLPQPITSRNARRVTFIRTTIERLLKATDLGDLIVGSPAEEQLVRELRERDLEVDRKVYMQISDRMVEVDLGLFLEEGQLGLCYEEGREGTGQPETNVWNLLRFSPDAIESDLEECLCQILEMVRRIREES